MKINKRSPLTGKPLRNPKALPDFRSHEAEVLVRDDVKLAAFHLSCFIRGSTTSTT